MPFSTTLSDCRKATLKKLSFIPIAGLKGRLAISDIKQQWTTLILLTDIFTVFLDAIKSISILLEVTYFGLIKTDGKRGKFLIEISMDFFMNPDPIQTTILEKSVIWQLLN